MKTKTMITMALVGGGLVLVYLYLRKSGTWATLFPGQATNEFTDQQKLLAYCMAQNLQVDQGGQAIFIDQSGARHAASCADWLHAQSGGGQAAGLSAVKQVDGTLLGKLRTAALSSPVMGVDRANVDQWNLLLRDLDPQARTSDLAEVGIRRGENDQMSAEHYLELRHRAGLTALAPVEPHFENPMSWVN